MKRGDYQIISAEDNKTIDRIEFAKKVKPGMILEISIILRQLMPLQDTSKTCPRCCHVNINTTVTNSGWIEWQVPLYISIT